MEGSFFEKLKKGMDIEETREEESKTEKSDEIKEIAVELKTEESPSPEIIEDKEKKQKEKKMKKKEKAEPKKAASEKEKWPKAEGQLAVDVYQTESELVIQSAIAGVKPEELDISIEGDLITIKGERRRPSEEGEDYFSQECYWGSFSRKIILPVEVDPGRIEATLNEGILTVRMPKISREKKMKVTVKKL